MDDSSGKTRSYFYRQIAQDLHKLLERRDPPTDRTQRVLKVNLQERLDMLVFCPVDGSHLEMDVDDPMTRSCDVHGDFTITEVWLNGDVTFEFIMLAPEIIEEQIHTHEPE